MPKLGDGSINLRELMRLIPDDVVDRYQRADRAVVAAVAEMYATTPPRTRRSASRRGSAYQGCRRTRSAP